MVSEQYIDDYHLLRLLGEGNNSEVYLGEHPRFEHLVAIKLLHTRTSEREVQRFLTQSAIWNKLDHPHIIHVYDFGLTYSGIPYLVMSYAPRGTLRQRYPRGTRLPLAEVVSYVRQAADALQYVHEHQLVHRDVKPQNMLLGARDEIILNDFGTATVSYSLVPNAVDFEGTVLYAAPEQLEGRSLRGSDQYALAIMTHELLCGSWPFIGTFEEVTRKHLFEQPPTLRSKGIDVSLTVEEALQRALSKDPGRRFSCIQDFADALHAACRPDNMPNQSQKPPSQQAARKQFRSPLPFM
ncbi:MAG TPA: serine/threonine-protein kinase [Ktedonobacteraceae bacterium]|nr:serine/threonine-protein kinase [Ktedonobacteraceae bacterium]